MDKVKKAVNPVINAGAKTMLKVRLRVSLDSVEHHNCGSAALRQVGDKSCRLGEDSRRVALHPWQTFFEKKLAAREKGKSTELRPPW